MDGLSQWFPPPPHEGPPLPRWMLQPKPEPEPAPIQHVGCEYGISCIKDHMGRAHLYINEAIRFSSAGEITPEARQKIRQARAELQCEDDFTAAMGAPIEIRSDVLRLLAACRSAWKGMDQTGLDTASGTIDDLTCIQCAIDHLWQTAYDIEAHFQESKEAASS